MAASGTTKKITSNQILGAGGTATLASATITGDLTVDTSTLKVDSANDRVGIGTASPAAGAKLGVLGATSVSTSDYVGSSTWAARFIGSSNGASSGISLLTNSAAGQPTPASIHATPIADFRSALTATYSADNTGAGYFAVNRFNPSGSNTLEHYKIDATGIATWSNVGGVAGTAMTLNASGLGVGVVPAAGKGALQLSSGINFPATQVASSDVNTLDDYEEGTWTIGLTFGGGSTGITTTLNTGRYTKVGRQVTVSGLLSLTSKGSSTGIAEITGLPFTIANANEAYSAANVRFNGISFADVPICIGAINSTKILLQEITNAGNVTDITDADFTNASSCIISLTYTV
jgi:hypothetical protein